MYGRTYRNFELEATHARDSGSVDRIMRIGAVVARLVAMMNDMGSIIWNYHISQTLRSI